MLLMILKLDEKFIKEKIISYIVSCIKEIEKINWEYKEDELEERFKELEKKCDNCNIY